MLSVLPVVLSASLLLPSASVSKEALLTSSTRHVRTTDRFVQQLIGAGLERSPTLYALIARLEATDVIVYIEPVNQLPGSIVGRLLLMSRGGTQRYLRIQLAIGRSSTESIALLGHELRHALEVAEARGVRDQKDLLALYQRIGDRSNRGVHQFDTAAARSAGQRVQRELA